MSTDRDVGLPVEPPVDRPIDPELSLGELFGRLGTDLGDLLTTQVQLARTELRDEAKEAGRSAAAFGAAGLLGYLALTLACFAAAWGLAEVMPEGWAFLIVAVVVAIVAGVLAVRGRAELRRATPVAPKTVEEIKEDVAWTREQVS